VLTDTLGHVRAPWSRKKLDYDTVKALTCALRIGDIILIRTNGELSTLAIPGFWKHAAIYVGTDEKGDHQIIEAVNPVVRMSYLANLVMRTDNVAVRRIKDVTEDQVKALVNFAFKQLGKKYDKSLKIWDLEEVYCSEIVYHGVNNVMGYGFVELRERFGYPSFTPDDCYKANKKFETVFEVRS
jgi:uncharacterized protein YycO